MIAPSTGQIDCLGKCGSDDHPVNCQGACDYGNTFSVHRPVPTVLEFQIGNRAVSRSTHLDELAQRPLRTQVSTPSKLDTSARRASDISRREE